MEHLNSDTEWSKKEETKLPPGIFDVLPEILYKSNQPGNKINTAEEIAIIQGGLDLDVYKPEDLDEEARNLIGLK